MFYYPQHAEGVYCQVVGEDVQTARTSLDIGIKSTHCELVGRF